MRVYSGRVITLDVDTVTFPDGSTGELEIIRHPGAAAVVPVLSDPAGPDPTILMLRQYRYATGGTLWEVPAGTLGADEAPAACARRELEEEAGVRAGRLEPLTTIWTTPGFTTETIHLFWAADLTATRAAPKRGGFSPASTGAAVASRRSATARRHTRLAAASRRHGASARFYALR